MASQVFGNIGLGEDLPDDTKPLLKRMSTRNLDHQEQMQLNF